MKAYDRRNMPKNVGFVIRLVTDKDYRPERIQKLIEIAQFWSSVRNDLPEGLNVIEPVTEEIFRLSGLSPRLLRKPVPVGDRLSVAIQKATRQSGGGANLLTNEVAGEAEGAAAGGVSIRQTPIGPVPTSPIPNYVADTL